MLSVNQHWDPLEVCAVGRSYPPEFYSFVKNSKARSVLERIAIETEEDYQKLIKLLESFGVTIIRNDISDNREDHFWCGYYSPPPMTPRDHTIMVGEKFFMPGENYGWAPFEPLTNFTEELTILQKELNLSIEEKEKLSKSILTKLSSAKKLQPDDNTIQNQLKSIIRSINHNPLRTFPNNKKFDTFSSIKKFISDTGNPIVYDKYINGATTTRIGKDIYFGSLYPEEHQEYIIKHLKNIREDLELDYRFHVVHANSHSDAVFTPVKPGLIISIVGAPCFKQSFPDWEVVSLPGQSFEKVQPFLNLKKKNAGKWWVPGEELNDDFTDFVETWLKDWVLYVEETVFDVNMLVINPTNVVVNNYNKNVFDAFERHGITPHIVNLRHRYFWDGGLHCITSDLSRKGKLQNYFPERDKK